MRGQIQPGGAQVAPRAKWVGPGSVLAVDDLDQYDGRALASCR